MGTLIRIGLENGLPGRRSQAWLLDYPGCFTYGADGSAALLNAPRALLAYAEWVDRRARPSWMADLTDFDIRLVDTWQNYAINDLFEPAVDGYEVEAWFRDDWRPLGGVDIQRGLLLLGWSRADLLQITAELPDEKLDATYPGERWSIRGILGHIANADTWYLDRLGLAEGLGSGEEMGVFERLERVRARLREVLPRLEEVRRVVGVEGEFWSPRKLLRRALWHERDHIDHICKIL